MPRQSEQGNGRRRRSSARSLEAREAELTSAAYDLAERQIEEGTASSQVVTHFLRAGSMRERLDQLKVQHEIELMEVRQENLRAQTRVEELYEEAITAMRSYQGHELPPGEFAED